MADQHVFKFLHLEGSPAVKNAAVDGSVASKAFVYNPDENVEISRMIVMIQTAANISAEKYGDQAVLTNGVNVEWIRTNNGTLDLVDGLYVKSNAHWGGLCYDVDHWDPSVGNKFVLVRWTFGQTGKPLYMYPGDEFRVVIRDDLTGLVAQTFMLQGSRPLQ